MPESSPRGKSPARPPAPDRPAPVRARGSAPSPGVRRSRRIVALVALLAVGGLALALTLVNVKSQRAATGNRARASGGSVSPKHSGPAAAPPARSTLNAARIGHLSLTLKEPSSSAIATGHSSIGAPVRVLPIKLRFPIPVSGAAGPVAGAPFPLVVFSQGFDEPARAYAGLLSAWSRAGYVVAAPIYPFTDPSSPTGVDENDIVNHPADLRFVIGTLKRMSREPKSPLHRVLDPRRVAIAGQSDGGDVSLAVAADSCCRSGSVRAAMILSGAELAAFGGSYYRTGSVPLLVTQGSDDTINPPGCSRQLYDGAPQPKYFLSIAGAEHLPPYVSPGPIRSGIIRLTIAFLNAYLKHEATGTRALGSAARLPSQETLTGAPTAPGAASNYCPGAP